MTLTTYALARIHAAWTTTEPDPAAIVYSAHAGYFWRALAAAYAGGIASVIGWTLAGRSPDRVARVITFALPLAVLVALAQALLVP